MSIGKSKSEAVQLNEFREKTLDSYREAAKKRGCQYLHCYCLAHIKHLVTSECSDKLLRKMIEIAIEAYDLVANDTTLPWGVK
ncbi:hypothetical protein Desde_3210 [Desulfitobacterium dehalogenans ATCC 51507]|uniref:Uncharacterized protein n=1 Tax=Desulfitobacterium dehalogenans (strain ATCC 51507 / DSM 9161 / JW/IU-DC1) TaxID=756499 RepID=I4AC16_DESDJ|nr:hypothetical protein [Desulfitobacterium dehalogenans]AFM01501.1 hypothetical protein Desde_3210 [Desulfitobacterium dehalogenans ATCC 51507]